MRDISTIVRILHRLDESVRSLRSNVGPSLAEFEEDRRLQAAVERWLQLSIQACVDMAEELVIEYELEMPETYAENFLVLQRAGVVDAEMSRRMVALVRFRNVLVHEYVDLDSERVYRAWYEEVDTLEQFAQLIRRLIQTDRS